MKKSILILLALLAGTAQADEWSFGVGLGSQYGGSLGFNIAKEDNQSKLIVGLGLGGSVSYDRAFKPNGHHSIGFSAGMKSYDPDKAFGTLNYNYHINGFGHSGFMLGASLGKARKYHSAPDMFEWDNTLGINLGYQF